MVIILHNIVSTADGYQHIYRDDGQAELKGSVLATIQNITQLSPITEYARFSGAETGFGFFAPQVGSQYISNFKTFDAAGKLLGETIAPRIKQQEGLLRYSSYLDLFQNMLHAEDKLKQNKSDSLSIRVAHAVVYSMADRILNRSDSATKVEANIYLYNYSNLRKHQHEKAPRYISIYQKTIEKTVTPKQGL